MGDREIHHPACPCSVTMRPLLVICLALCLTLAAARPPLKASKINLLKRILSLLDEQEQADGDEPVFKLEVKTNEEKRQLARLTGEGNHLAVYFARDYGRHQNTNLLEFHVSYWVKGSTIKLDAGKFGWQENHNAVNIYPKDTPNTFEVKVCRYYNGKFDRCDSNEAE